MREIKAKYFNLFTVVRDCLYNWWVILLAGIIGFCGCQIYYSAFLKTRYTSSMTIAVNLSGYTTEATVVTLARVIQIATSFEEILQSPVLVDIVEQEIGEEITGVVEAHQIIETNLITISVTDVSPEKAFRTLTAIFDNHTAITDTAFNNIIINVLSNPNMPSTYSNQRQMMIESIEFALLGMIICAAIITVISYFRDTIKNVSDVENLLEGSLFGTIYHVNKRRSKIKKTNDGLLLTNPLISFAFSDSFREMATKLSSLQRTKNLKSFVITSAAENEGKTTITVNLAIALSEMGKRVIIVDSDFKLPAIYKFFDQSKAVEEKELGEFILGNNNELSSIIRRDRRTGIYLACGKKKYKNSSEMVNSESFVNMICALENEFDVVLIDTPPACVVLDAEIIAERASAMLFVVRQDFSPVEPINEFLSNIEHEKLIGCIINDVSVIKWRRRGNEDVAQVYE